ncbi:PspA/IM30 family protein [Aeromicrobium sp. SMF47]|uniref:PspA/IM30 family protein n=1 Tax=Aeromicrobium yanjiei TaxID=2662028 RepID=A0A5Q2MH28_9ACTN|nr:MULTISPECIES: PspA/IM30 family protein [Aeromicrobium]MRJ77843.1 PspA/IM30 family protein [Aeromicrobium yanjiei]MRK02212.1 PspA/IM30 family protein [Aeromicrobium sp. S22]QGG41069.1 PspA/IM30 family protein [Aeromicrobium yanjiei]
MSIGQRVTRWWRSRRADSDDPGALKDRLDETYRNQTALLRQVRRGVADVATSRKRVELQLASIAQQASQLDDQARQAVDQGNDDVARAFLTRKVMLEKTAADLEERRASLKAEEDKLELAAMKVEQEVEGFRVRKDTLAARHTAASARAEINSATTGIGSAVSDVNQAMESAERRTRELEAQSDAVDELVAEGIVTKAGESPDDALRRQFDAALDDAEVDRQLDQITHRKDDSGTHPISE